MAEFLRAADFNRSWKDLRTIVVGDQIKTNHVGCTSGEDTRSRLYIKRKNMSEWVAYCHNCGLGGVWRDGKTLSFGEIAEYTKSKDVEVVRTGKRVLQADQEHFQHSEGWQSMKPEEMGNTYLSAYLSKFPAAQDLYYFVNEAEEKLRLSIQNHYDVVGHSERCFLPGHMGPKWKITYYTDSEGDLLAGASPVNFKQHFNKGWTQSDAGRKILLITEDILSARCAEKYIGCDTLALLRTTISISDLQRVVNLSCPDVILIALDRDIPGKEATGDLWKQLGLVCQKSTWINNLWNLNPYHESKAKDFKDLPIADIQGIRKIK